MRCHPIESEQYYRVLKRNGVPTEMLRLPGSPHGGAADEVPDVVGTHEDESIIERDRARRAMSCLSMAERQLLSQAYFYGWTAREIAEAEGIPLGTVKTRLRTALIKLRAANAEEARTGIRIGQEEVAP